MLTHLHIAYGCFHATAELSTARELLDFKASHAHYLAIYRKILLTS